MVPATAADWHPLSAFVPSPRYEPFNGTDDCIDCPARGTAASSGA
jgi:hypothetical protein